MVTLPDAAEATTESEAAQAAAIATAQTNFIAEVTVLINNAITNGLYYVEPFVDPLVTPTYVTNYFTPLGYTVLYPISPNYPYNSAFVPGFPEVLPPGYQQPNLPQTPGRPRIKISWHNPNIPS